MMEVRKRVIDVKNNGAVTEIYVSGDIVDDRWKGWSWEDDVETFPQDIRDILKDAKGDVHVYIASGGGDLFAGMAISNILKRYKGNTKAIIDGLAGSAASIIAFGCDEIEMPSNAYIMIHKPSAGIIGNSDDFLHYAEVLDECQKGIVATYLSKAKEGVTEDKINEMVNAETWLTGKSAKEYFNIVITGDATFTNDFGGSIYNYANTPEALKKDNAKEQEIINALKFY